ncbi:Cell cycle checkpoint control protein [Gryllus bimaculatus]|nr:Cell cycle checkpoint control protein [Gryllus bimaculatus]
MKCTIPGANMKVLARAVQSLARIGDELYVEPDANSMSFRSVNSSRSAYASFTFNRSFFAFYKHEPSQPLNSSQEDSCKCKISMKSCLPVFRSPVMLDRKVENCKMRLEDDGCKLVFEMKFRMGIAKTHFLPVIECETLQVVYTKDDASNSLLAQVQLFSDTVHNFHSTQEEVTLSVTSQKTSIRSYTDGSIMKHENTYEASFVLSTLSPEIDSTPQRMREQNSNTPVVSSVGTGAKEPTIPPNVRQSTSVASRINLTPSNENRLEEHFPELRGGTPRGVERVSVRKGESPSLLSNTRSDKSGNTSSRHHPDQTRGEKRSRPLERTVNNQEGSAREDIHNNTHASFQGNRLNSSCVLSNRMMASNAINQERTSKDLSSAQQDFNTPPLMMSNASSVSLQLRESDNEDDTVASSPQPVRKRPRLLDIFDSTFDPTNIPGHDIIIADDSGDEPS